MHLRRILARMSCTSAVAALVLCGLNAIAQAPRRETEHQEVAVRLFAEDVESGEERLMVTDGGATATVDRREVRTRWEPWTWQRCETRVTVAATLREEQGRLAAVDLRMQVDATANTGSVRIVDGAAVWSGPGPATREPVPAEVTLVPDGLTTPWIRALTGPLPKAIGLLLATSPRLVVARVAPGPGGRFVHHDGIPLESLRLDFGEFTIDVWRDATEPVVVRDSRSPCEARRATRPGWSPQSMRITLAPETVREEDVRVTNGTLGLFGVLASPRGTPPTVAALLLSGSGPDGADARIGGMPFLDRIAVALAVANVVSLRCADRGVGRSEGTFTGIRVEDLQADAAAALAFLRKRHPDLPVVVVGHSEGAVIAARLAAADPSLRGVALLGCPAMPVTEVIVQQAPALHAELGGAAVEEADRLARLFATAARCTGSSMTTANGDVVQVGWIQDHAALRPSELVAGLPCRVELFQGLADRHVQPAHADALETARRRHGHALVVHRLPGLDHAFVAAPPDAPGPGPERAIDEAFLQLLCERVGKLAG